MSKIMNLQRELANRGMYAGDIDGDWGPLTQEALHSLFATADNGCQPRMKTLYNEGRNIAYGAKVSSAFKARVIWIAKELEVNPDWIMACIAFESGGTFSPSIRNAAGSGATGLIQFMPSTALHLFHSKQDIDKMNREERRMAGLSACDKLANMKAEDQLEYVYKYFFPYKARLKNMGDVYMSILWPAGIGKSDDWPLWSKSKRPTTYRQNSGLDVNKDGVITRGEAISKIMARLSDGTSPENYG